MQQATARKKESARGQAAQMPEKVVRKATTVADLMRTTAVACHEDTPANEVAQIMVVNRIRYCFVTNDRGELVGIIAARSLQHATGREGVLAKEVMLPGIVTITPKETIEQAAAEMYRNRVQHLAVILDRQGSQAVLGIIGATDILQSIVAQEKEGY